MLHGDRLKHLREIRGYTHTELAELLEVSYPQIYRYEAGKSDPSGDVISRMANLFNVTTDYLLGITDDSSPQIRVDNLTPTEKKVLAAMRQGHPLEAIKAIVDDTPALTV